MPAPYEKYLKEVLLTEAQLQQRIQELGQTISSIYDGCDNLLLICILKGGVVFMTDLMKYINVPHEIDFMAASSYGKGARASLGNVRIDMDINTNIEGRDVLIVEDIIDSGYTLRFVMDVLEARQPASLRLCALLNKSSRREVDIAVDFVGFEIPNKFVFGYGLDLDERFRNLPFVGVVDENALTDDAS